MKNLIVFAAEVAHENNRRYCESIGDNSQVSWEDAPGWQKQSATDGVRNIIDGGVTRPQDSHDSWMKTKEADGWVYGEIKDPDKKTHPCMVPFIDLPEEQKQKDFIFFHTVKAIIAIASPYTGPEWIGDIVRGISVRGFEGASIDEIQGAVDFINDHVKVSKDA